MSCSSLRNHTARHHRVLPLRPTDRTATQVPTIDEDCPGVLPESAESARADWRRNDRLANRRGKSDSTLRSSCTFGPVEVNSPQQNLEEQLRWMQPLTGILWAIRGEKRPFERRTLRSIASQPTTSRPTRSAPRWRPCRIKQRRPLGACGSRPLMWMSVPSGQDRTRRRKLRSPIARNATPNANITG